MCLFIITDNGSKILGKISARVRRALIPTISNDCIAAPLQHHCKMTTAASKAAFELLCSKLRDISSLRYRLPHPSTPSLHTPQPPHSSVSSLLEWDKVTSLPPAGSLARCAVAPSSSFSHASSSHPRPRRPMLCPLSRHPLQMHRPRSSTHPG